MNQANEAATTTAVGWNLATLVPEIERLDCLRRHFGGHFVRVEQTIFDWMGRLAPSYSGGYWRYFTLPNGGFYMAPEDGGNFAISCEGNGFAGTVSADAGGIIACLMAYSHLSFQVADPRLSEAFRKLLACVHRHPEGAAILRAID